MCSTFESKYEAKYMDDDGVALAGDRSGYFVWDDGS
jgi:hypothetical protein